MAAAGPQTPRVRGCTVPCGLGDAGSGPCPEAVLSSVCQPAAVCPAAAHVLRSGAETSTRAHLGTQVTLHGTETVSRPGGATAGRLGSRSHGAAGWAPLLPGRVGIVSRMVPLQDGSICCNLGKRSYLSNSLESLPWMW